MDQPTPDCEPVVLSDVDRRHLANVDRKFQLVRDRVAGVVRGQPGMLLVGAGGIGKSHTVSDELIRLDARHRVWNAHMTGFSLFTALAENPQEVHVLEDVEEVLRDRLSFGVLRSATWPTRKDRSGNPERVVTWSSGGKTREFVFGGGIIIISNRHLGSLPELQALATRITPVELTVSNEEIAALMRRVAARAYRRGDQILLDPEACSEVAEFLIAESARLRRPLNMRLLIHAFEDRVQADDCQAGLPWRDLVASRVAGQPSIVGPIEPVGIRAQRKSEELALARRIAALEPQARLTAWGDKTGKSRAALYRRLGELGAPDAKHFDD